MASIGRTILHGLVPIRWLIRPVWKCLAGGKHVSAGVPRLSALGVNGTGSCFYPSPAHEYTTRALAWEMKTAGGVKNRCSDFRARPGEILTRSTR